MELQAGVCVRTGAACPCPVAVLRNRCSRVKIENAGVSRSAVWERSMTSGGILQIGFSSPPQLPLSPWRSSGRRGRRQESMASVMGSETSVCECYDLFDQLVPYVDAWKWQKEIVARMCAAVGADEVPPHSVILLQHPPVYTMGTRSSDEYLHFDAVHPPFELHRTERGGEVTYHGPGQLVMYPIINLRNHKMDLHWYLRMLEEVVIRTLRSACCLEASRKDGLTGVWVGDVKVAAIGVRVSRWITYHGLALNVSTDLSHFQNIVPCGIADRPVGNVQELLKLAARDHEEPDSSYTPQVFCAKEKGLNMAAQVHLDDKYLLRRVRDSLLAEFMEVFRVQLVLPTKNWPFLNSHRT